MDGQFRGGMGRDLRINWFNGQIFNDPALSSIALRDGDARPLRHHPKSFYHIHSRSHPIEILFYHNITYDIWAFMFLCVMGTTSAPPRGAASIPGNIGSPHREALRPQPPIGFDISVRAPIFGTTRLAIVYIPSKIWGILVMLLVKNKLNENNKKKDDAAEGENDHAPKPRTRKHYTYLQLTASNKEKDLVRKFAEKEHFSTISDFLRRIVFDYIRKKENPELFIATNESDANALVLERIHKLIQDILKNQEYLLQREDVISDLRDMTTTLYKKAEAEALAKEKEVIVKLLEKHTSLSMRQIQEETGYPEDMVFKIISDMSVFKITQSGRFALR
jgi:hypothetical protein